MDAPTELTPEARFQSAPGGEAGGNSGTPTPMGPRSCFNPPPAVRPGETGQVLPCLGHHVFQSAPGGEAGGNPRARKEGGGS